MKSSHSGVKLSLVVISVVILGVSAWFNQGNGQYQHAYIMDDNTIEVLA
ncbi:hypothetical protein J8L70_07480 [Pseudoalteromonas sp. MMG010]|nr:hypothetical protein [Pseudoalteromonas sp. MMG010]MBQ4833077.1 hypothetical protein [Pseudoalteromonas sp. MMG010]